MSLKLTVLCENLVERVDPAGLLGEHGFACHIKTPEGNFLFDTGGGATILHNAKKMGINLQKLSGIILSHGHLDHTGGLLKILELTGPIPVYAHPDLFISRQSRNGNQLREIGIPWSQAELEPLGAKFQLSKSPRQITPSVTFSGEIPRKNPFERGDPNLITTSGGEQLQDRLADDCSLYLNSPQGLIILLGCAHAGALNIIEHAQNVTGQDKIHLLLGGTHLKFSSEELFETTLDKIKELGIARLGAAHCTGIKHANRLAEYFGAGFFYASVGTEISIDS